MAPGVAIGSAGQPATTPSRRAWATALSRNRGERRGAADMWGKDESRAQCQRRGVRGSVAAGRRQAGPASTVPGSMV
jgi:hypothetical protein